MSEDIVQAARACLGVRFRPQGRDVATGLDCVGLVAVAFRGRLSGALPADYAQRGGSLETISEMAARAGLRPTGRPGAGDLLLLRSGPAQWHFAVLTGDGFIHADARLRRVVEVPGAPPWPVAAAWSTEGDD